MPKKNDPQSKPHYKGLSVQEGKFVDEVVRQETEEGKINRSKAAQKAYNVKSKDVAKSVGSEVLARPDVRQAYLEEMRLKGLSDELSIKTHLQAFKATKRQRDYETGELTEIPDHAIRLRAVQEYRKVKGYYPRTTRRRASSKETEPPVEPTPQELAKVEEGLIESIRELKGEEG